MSTKPIQNRIIDSIRVIFAFCVLLCSKPILADDDSDLAETLKSYPYLISEKDIPENAPKFEDYRTEAIDTRKRGEIDLSDPQATRYRTVLRSWLKRGPNFNTIYSVATWGCGTGCIQIAVINCKTGRTIFPDEFTTIDAGHVYYKGPIRAVYFKINSSLIVISGALDEDKSKYGIHYYQLKNNKLIPIRFVKLKDSD